MRQTSYKSEQLAQYFVGVTIPLIDFPFTKDAILLKGAQMSLSLSAHNSLGYTRCNTYTILHTRV
jgi:hypothetical protein